jgi:hypothetical protein
MKVKLVNPEHAAALVDPHTKRSPFLDAKGRVQETADVPENNFWVRRVQDGSLERLDVPTQPTGNEPVAPLTTRGGK